MDLITAVGYLTILILVLKHLGPELWDMVLRMQGGYHEWLRHHREWLWKHVDHDHSECPACVGAFAAAEMAKYRQQELDAWRRAVELGEQSPKD